VLDLLSAAVWAFVVGMDEQPLTAMQVLYVNLVTACTLGIMLAAEPPEPNVMDRPPRRPGKRLLVSGTVLHADADAVVDAVLHECGLSG
jgi:magnesium-transporting ATPase (P-type)